MIIEIRGTGTHNKGAELMACAIVRRCGALIPGARFAVERQFGPYAVRAKYGLLTKVHARRLGRARLAQALMSRSFREQYGLVVDADVDAVLDASGFAFGDPWGPGPAEWLARQAPRWRRRGTRVVLLPQAFGPFENQRVRAAFRKGLDSVDALYARDPMSLEHVQEVAGPLPKVRAAPDFTNIVPGECPPDADLPDRFACIAPNLRMLDRTSAAERDAYVGFLARAIRALRHNDVEPLVVCHAGKEDRQVVQLVEGALLQPLRVLNEDDPVRLKGIVGRAAVLVGSRFHALVGALSQGVPAIGTSWSHKYEMLFEEYGCREFLLSPSASAGEVESLVERVCSGGGGGELRDQLRLRSGELRRRVEGMFGEVARLVGC